MSGNGLSQTQSQSLKEQLRKGSGVYRDPSIRDILGIDEQAGDKEFAMALVSALSENGVDEIDVADSNRYDPRRSEEISRVFTIDKSYLAQLGAGRSERLLDLERLSDPRILIAVIKAGTLSQRRSAIRRIGKLLQQPYELTPEQLRDLTESLSQLRDVEVAHELAEARLQLPGVAGKDQRATRKEWEHLALEVERAVIAFWEGNEIEEPIAALHVDQRAQLFAHVPDLPDTVIRHLTAVIEGADGVTDRAGRHGVIASLRYAGEPALVPCLRSILEGREGELLIPSARAIGHIGDCRVHGVLRSAYERALLPEHRVVLAGALGVVGDARGADYVRGILREGDPRLVGYALEALAQLGSREDCQIIAEILDREDPVLVTSAIRTLGRIGDSRALVPLRRLRQKTKRSALRAAIEEAEAAIRSHMELLGEEPPSTKAASEAFDTAKMAVMVTRKNPAEVGFDARWSLFIGHLWLLLGLLNKAVARFEAAASLRPGWVVPVLAVAMAYARREQYAQALYAFRRVLEIDRSVVEQSPAKISALSRCFLRRADMVERGGRPDIAYGLLEEVLNLDLRKASSALRVAIIQRHEQLRSKRA
ncbi:MAG: HEAT repeat domain-containing protein [Deltaproteobacteria bacterium]|nr:HEAT repeat domain-containing protein [Deltaproteobacteria bacterium]